MNIDITFKPITSKDIENLRVWKNAHKDVFFCKKDITKLEQVEWFKGYLKRNKSGNDFMYVIKFNDISVGCIGYRIIDGKIDLYNNILGDKEFSGWGIIKTFMRLLWKVLVTNYEYDITVKVLDTNYKMINWYLNNNWSILESYQDYKLLRYEGI